MSLLLLACCDRSPYPPPRRLLGEGLTSRAAAARPALEVHLAFAVALDNARRDVGVQEQVPIHLDVHVDMQEIKKGRLRLRAAQVFKGGNAQRGRTVARENLALPQ